MKNRIIQMIATLLLCFMIFSPVCSAGAVTGTIRVPKNCIMTSAGEATRTTKYGYVSVKANSVYPTGEYKKDNFTKCKTHLFHVTSHKAISNKVTLTEGKGYAKVIIQDGYLDQTKVNVCFAGNDPEYPAMVNYTYNGN